MKKLNEDVLRRLILETIDEQAGVIVEGKKKKKLKEAEPVMQPQEAPPASGTADDVGSTGMGSGYFDEPDQTVIPNLPSQLNLPKETINKALDALAGDDDMAKTGAWSILVQVADWISSKEKEIKKSFEERV